MMLMEVKLVDERMNASNAQSQNNSSFRNSTFVNKVRAPYGVT